MGARVRGDGRVLCAALHPHVAGDVYLPDGLLYELSMRGVLVTEAWNERGGRGGHGQHGEWWWRGHVPDDVVLESRANFP